MKCILWLLVDADKKFWVQTSEKDVVEDFNENNGVLPMKLTKITVECEVPVAQEIFITIPKDVDEAPLVSLESQDG